jgi:hypothetical protein
MSDNKYDLSHVFGNPDLEGAQDNWDELPQEMKDHLFRFLEHKTGFSPHPGKYKGPGIESEN